MNRFNNYPVASGLLAGTIGLTALIGNIASEGSAEIMELKNLFASVRI